MNARDDQALLEKLKNLPPQQRAEVEDFVDFLAAKTRKRAARTERRADKDKEQVKDVDEDRS